MKIDHQEYHVRAKTHTLTGYSAHADQADLIKFVQGIPNKPREIRLVHGEDQAKAVLAEKLKALGYTVNASVSGRTLELPPGFDPKHPDTSKSSQSE